MFNGGLPFPPARQKAFFKIKEGSVPQKDHILQVAKDSGYLAGGKNSGHEQESR